MTPPLIALEEHYYSSAIFSSLDPRFQHQLSAIPGLANSLREVGNERLASMDDGHIALQVISHAFTPGSPSAENCRLGNDELAHAIASSGHAERYAAFAVLPVGSPSESALELARTVSSHHFVGALVDNHANGKHFDGPEYDVLWSQACELDVPIYLHPTFPSMEAAKGFMGAYPLNVGISLGAAGYGWHGDVGLHVLKLFCAGVFDRFPKLKVVVGHFGETLPFMLERCEDMSERWGGWGKRERGLRRVWDENVWVTTSGAWSLGPMKCLVENTKVDRVLYSVDYPFESNGKGREWFEKLEASGLLSEEELRGVAYGNAEALLRVKAKG
ncbi:uncharacterized protein KY384_007258 [Bacidia gigantensis]|uniref:uncharacterized protein n=1 Tax=Bacidia gigantensis TaxID=2732470 RepID=UPI001D059742|nr:uncharacterized protein KY384_007258 [Bacidia gigantensis]KAG8528340.1 hypothetical protein KY384_007258 [Bacidia gigantensis]